ncbi:MAG TPA: RraA family protein [Aliidongia sp.]|nr:RraA family protein [Aliidongia sp.]
MAAFRIRRRQRRVEAALVERFRAVPVSNVSDVMARTEWPAPRLRPMHRGGILAGPALTVRTRSGDNLLVHKAIDMAEPGDVVVVDAGGDLTKAIIGEMMAARAQKRGLAGLVIYGAVRDSAALRAGDFPVFAAGITYRGPTREGPGEINGPVGLDGMDVAPGDLILGDEDGVLCVPFDGAAAILAAAEANQAAEEKALVAIRAGTQDKSWVDEALQRLGCVIEP